MKLSLFKKGLHISKLNDYLELINGYAEDRNQSASNYYKIDELSADSVIYKFYCAFSLNVIKKVYLLRYEGNLFGLSLYNLETEEVRDITDCIFVNISTVCYNAFLLESLFGESILVIDGEQVASDMNFMEVYSFLNSITVIRVCDIDNNFQYFGVSVIGNGFYTFNSINEFIHDFREMVDELVNLDYFESIPVGYFKDFISTVLGQMSLDGII